MNKITLGLRYERLLMLAAPISLACLLVLFIAVASDLDADRKVASCYEIGASSLEEKLPELKSKWDKLNPIQVDSWSSYKLEISYVVIHAMFGTDCYKVIDNEIDSRYKAAPEEIVAILRKDAATIKLRNDSKPVQAFGVEMPDRATINVFGTNIKITVIIFAQLLQLALAPILTLWLGSLYNTRYRETLYISNAKEINDLFPHSINIYLVGLFSPLRKRNWVGFYGKIIFPYIPTIFRMTILSAFIAPPVAAYCLSLYYLRAANYLALSITIGGLVLCFTAVNFILEMMPWHSGKYFQDGRVTVKKA